MCYQCSGCGKCLGGEYQNKATTTCPCCRYEVETGVRRCPKCGAFIRPKTGSVLARKPKAVREEH